MNVPEADWERREKYFLASGRIKIMVKVPPLGQRPTQTDKGLTKASMLQINELFGVFINA